MVGPRRFALLAAVVAAVTVWPATPANGQTHPATPTLLELIAPGSVVADVGAGAGDLTVVLAQHVGPTGHVYATEIDLPRLDQIRRRTAEQGLENVTVFPAAARATNLPVRCCDAVVLRNVYHHLEHPDAINRDLSSLVVRPGGMLVVIDFTPRPDTEPPAGVPANRGGHGVPIEIVIEEVEAAGLEHVETTRYPPEGGNLYLILFRKPPM